MAIKETVGELCEQHGSALSSCCCSVILWTTPSRDNDKHKYLWQCWKILTDLLNGGQTTVHIYFGEIYNAPTI